jgi:hypothetical protein
MAAKLGNRALKLTLRFGLAGLGLLLWHAPSAKAQECCPNQYTEAELAKSGNSVRKAAKLVVANDKQAKTSLIEKVEPISTPGAKASHKDKTNNPASAQAVSLKQPVKSSEKKQ